MRALPFLLVILLAGAESAAADWQVLRNHSDRSQTTCLAPLGDELWIGTIGGGLVRLGSGGLDVVDAARGLPGNRVHGCVAHRGRVYAATEGGLVRVDPSTLRVDPVLPGRFLALAANGDGVIAASAARVLHDLGEGSRTPLEMSPSALGLHDDGTWAAGDIGGVVLVSAPGAGLSRFTVGAPVEHIETRPDGFAVVTPLGRIRIDLMRGTLGDDAPAGVRGDGSGGDVDLRGLGQRHVRAVARWQGRAVVATSDGAFSLRAGRFEPVDLGGNPCGDRIASLEVMGDALWAGSFDRGLCRFDGSSWERWSGPKHLPSDMVHDMSAAGDRLWVATHRGVAVVGEQGPVEQSTVEDCRDTGRRDCPWHATVNGVTTDLKTGAVWMADIGAVHRIGERRWRHFYRKAGIRSPRLTRIAAWFGHVAVGTGDTGVLLLEGGRRFIPVDDQQGVADNWVMDLAYDERGRLWVGTCTRGLSRLAGGRWRTFTTEDGLADDYVLSVKPVGKEIWVGTLKGLSVLTPRGGERYAVTTLDRSRGLGGDEVHDVASWRGRVWVATDGGIAEVGGGASQ